MCAMTLRIATLMVLTWVGVCLLATSAQATFPGRNGEIFYRVGWQSRYDSPPNSVEAINPRTKAVRVLASNDIPRSYWGDIGVAPDGRRLALIETVQLPYGGELRLLLMDTEGRVVRQPLPADSSPERPSWSPDKNSVLLRRRVSGVPQLSILGLDGTEHGVAARGDPSTPDLDTGWGNSFDWSSRGVVAFLGTVPDGCLVGCRYELFVARPGDAARRITRRGAGKQLSWSPDGRWIAFVRRSAGAIYADVFIARSDGSRVRRLTYRTGFAPSWSPDGKRIAFLRRGVLYTVKTRGTDLRKIRRIAADLQDPYLEGRAVWSIDWQPRP
jgi:dipeptidyl aminopeptidase/acylaminoacyl peptidase